MLPGRAAVQPGCNPACCSVFHLLPRLWQPADFSNQFLSDPKIFNTSQNDTNDLFCSVASLQICVQPSLPHCCLPLSFYISLHNMGGASFFLLLLLSNYLRCVFYEKKIVLITKSSVLLRCCQVKSTPWHHPCCIFVLLKHPEFLQAFSLCIYATPIRFSAGKQLMCMIAYCLHVHSALLQYKKGDKMAKTFIKRPFFSSKLQ